MELKQIVMDNYKRQTENEQGSQSFYEKEEAYLRAKRRLKKIKGFYWHAFWYIVINVFIIVTLVVNHEGENIWHFGTFSTPIFWGIGLGFHALSVFGKNIFFSKAWEERQMKKYIDKDKKRWE